MIYEALYEWQRKLVDELKGKPSFGLFLDCGTGKTPISIALAEANQCTKILVISLNTKALEKYTIDGSFGDWIKRSNENFNVYNKVYNKPPQPLEAFIINYESLFERKKDSIKSAKKVELREDVKNFIASCQNNNVAIIIDESHKVKTEKSMLTQSIQLIYSLMQKVASKTFLYLLTGTPFTRGYEDLFAQLKLLGCPYTKTRFRAEFCILGHYPSLAEWQQPIVGYKNIDALFELVKNYAIFIESDSVSTLPEKIFVEMPYDSPEVFQLFCKKKAHKEDVAKECTKRGIKLEDYWEDIDSKTIANPFYCDMDFPKSRWYAQTPSAQWLRARQLSIGFQGNNDDFEWFDTTRLNMLKKFLKDNQDNYLIFYSYTAELLAIYDICNDLGYNIDVMCGDIKSRTFYDKYCKMSDTKKLQNRNNVMIANYASGSTGLNLQEYSKTILFDTPLFKDYEQGIKRTNRYGQRNVTIYYKIYSKSFIDLEMQKALEEKKDYNSNMFESDFKKVEALMLQEND